VSTLLQNPKEQEFRQKLDAIVDRMAELGYRVAVISKRRSTEEQNKLFQKGRDESGRVTGKIVTEADGIKKLSFHQLGLGADLAFLDKKGNPSFSEDHPWKKLGEIAEKEGLTWGGRWKDLVDRTHVQLGEGLPDSDKQDVIETAPKKKPGFLASLMSSVPVRTLPRGMQARFDPTSLLPSATVRAAAPVPVPIPGPPPPTTLARAPIAPVPVSTPAPIAGPPPPPLIPAPVSSPTPIPTFVPAPEPTPGPITVPPLTSTDSPIQPSASTTPEPVTFGQDDVAFGADDVPVSIGKSIQTLKSDPDFWKFDKEARVRIVKKVLGDAEAQKFAVSDTGPGLKAGTPRTSSEKFSDLTGLAPTPAQAFERLIGTPSGPTPTTEEAPLGEADAAAIIRGLVTTAAIAAAPHLAGTAAGLPSAVGEVVKTGGLGRIATLLGLGLPGAIGGEYVGRKGGETVGLPEMGSITGETIGGGLGIPALRLLPKPRLPLPNEMAARVLAALRNTPPGRPAGAAPAPLSNFIRSILRGANAEERQAIIDRGPVRGTFKPEDPGYDIPESAGRVVKTPQEAAVEGQVQPSSLVEVAPPEIIQPVEPSGMKISGPMAEPGAGIVTDADTAEARNFMTWLRGEIITQKAIAEAKGRPISLDNLLMSILRNAAEAGARGGAKKAETAAERMSVIDRGPVRGTFGGDAAEGRATPRPVDETPVPVIENASGESEASA